MDRRAGRERRALWERGGQVTVGSMFLRESIEPCTTCKELTPHSRRGLAMPGGLPIAGVLVAFVVSVLVVLSLGVPGLVIGLPLFVASIWWTTWNRERFWSIPCERCRGKKLAARRHLKPYPGRATEVGPF